MPRCDGFWGRLLALAAAAAAPQPAKAGSATDQLAVSATVRSGCTLNGGQLDFGTYVPGQTTDLDAIGSIDYVNCGGDLLFALDGGGGGDIGDRAMSGPEDGRLSYQLYRDPSRNAVWGTGPEGRAATLLSPQSGSVWVYGRIPKEQVVPPGIYTDVVNITLSF